MRQTRMGAGVRGVKLAWREGSMLSSPETCCGKQQGATTGLGGGFSHS